MVGYTYEQRTGKLKRPDGSLMATGYSGCGRGLDNPDLETDPGVGPIPRGQWSINLTPLENTSVGPFALVLLPVNHDAHKRSLFRMHGDNSKGNFSASHGCIIMPRFVRQEIIEKGITVLNVVHG